MRDLQWEVTLSNRPQLYYKGRGDTPEAALSDLITSLEMGLAKSEQELAGLQKRLEMLREALATMS